MQIKFWGDYGLFTRPEYKAEPHSYSVLTPTAAIGLLESIFWKPEFKYLIHRITILSPIRFLTMQRNMGQSKQSPVTAKKWMKNKGVGRYLIDRDRAQRNHTILVNPAYLLDFRIDLEPHTEESPEKYLAQLKRRIDRGQCYKQPYFGCREYAAFFSWPDKSDRPPDELMGERDFGMMPKALHYVRSSSGKISWRDKSTRRYVKGRVVPEFFHARALDGVINLT